MSNNDDLYVNYQPSTESPPVIVPRIKRRAQGLTPAASCLDLSAEVTLDRAVHPAQIGFKIPAGLSSVDPDEDFGARCHHWEAQNLGSYGSKLKVPSVGMYHAHSTPNLLNASDETNNEIQLPKKKKKGFQRFIYFLRKVKKGKEQFDKIIHHPLMEQLGVPELLDEAKDMAIDAVH